MEQLPVLPANSNFKVAYAELLSVKNSLEIDELEVFHRKRSSSDEVYSLALETYATTDPKLKSIARVCLVDFEGVRVLDTLVAPEPFSDPSVKLVMKDGIKRKLYELAKAKAPPLQEVREALKFFIASRKVVGYHLPMKLTDVGLLGISSFMSNK